MGSMCGSEEAKDATPNAATRENQNKATRESHTSEEPNAPLSEADSKNAIEPTPEEEEPSQSMPSEAEELVKGMNLCDEMGDPLSVETIKLLDKARLSVYNETIKMLSDLHSQHGSGGTVLSVIGKTGDEEIREKIVYINPASQVSEEIKISCCIMMDDYSPSDVLEYKFDDTDHNQWMVSNICMDGLEGYLDSKFENWKELILTTDCKATLRRMLKIKVINRIYDDIAFPSPQHEIEKFQVKDSKGKMVAIPRPVCALRRWDPTSQKYESVSPILNGAPSDEEKERYWQNEILAQLIETRGEDDVNELLKPESADNN